MGRLSFLRLFAFCSICLACGMAFQPQTTRSASPKAQASASPHQPLDQPPSTSSSLWLPLVTKSRSLTGKWGLWLNGPKLRGANIWQRIRVPSLDQEYLGDEYIGPPYSQADFNRLASLGANYVNLSLPGLYTITPPYQVDERAVAHLDQILEQIAQADLFAVISFRSGPGRSDFTFYRDGAGVWYPADLLVETVWSDQAAQDAWVEMWRYTAQRYRNHPNVVGYTLMVEPNADEVALDIYDPDEFYPRYANTLYDWNRLYPPIVQAIRSVDAETPILVSGMGWASVLWLPYLLPVSDEHTVFVVDQYAPFPYTHQQPNQNYSYPGTFDLNWDGEPDPFNWAWLEAYFSRLQAFRERYPGPQAVNEFGVVRWAPKGVDFLRDQIDYFESRGMNHAVWVWDSSWGPWQTWGSKAMNYLFGPDPNNFTEVPNEILSLLQTVWSRNTLRPSNYP